MELYSDVGVVFGCNVRTLFDLSFQVIRYGFEDWVSLTLYYLPTTKLPRIKHHETMYRYLLIKYIIISVVNRCRSHRSRVSFYTLLSVMTHIDS